MDDILTLDHVSKRFGALTVLGDVTFSVPAHAVFGLIGKNGAGKTTTMKLILGFLRTSSGEIRVGGEPVVFGGAATNRLIGYLPDVPEFYGYMRPREYLRFCGELAGMKPARIRARSDKLLEMVGLADIKRRIHGFSRGMKQRLGIAQALLGEPRLLICDEPTSALDPVGRKEILDLLALAGRETAILFSTHILSDVERICDRIGVLDKGRIVLQGGLGEIKNTYRQDTIRLELTDAEAARRVAQACRALTNVGVLGPNDASGKPPAPGKPSDAGIPPVIGNGENAVLLRVADARAQTPELLALLLREQAPLLKFEVLEPTLEDVFLGVVQ